jgi:hypothetical protein
VCKSKFPDDVSGAAVGPILNGHKLERKRARPTNQPTKGLTRGGDLRFAQVDVPSSVQPFLHVTESMGSVTDRLYYNMDCALR